MKWFAVLFITVIYDWLWARYTIACAHRQPIRASIASALIFASGGFVVVEYVNDHWLLIPACLGAAIGTFLAVRD